MTTKSVVVLDYGSGNLRSAQRALQRVGAAVEVTADLDAGRGRRRTGGAGRRRFRGVHGRPAGDRRRAGHRRTDRRAGDRCWACASACRSCSPAVSSSACESDGCGQWPGAVTRLDAPVIPHMGWNVVTAAPGSALFKGLDADTRFYFVHSYAAQRWEGGSRGAADLGHPRGAVPGRGRGRAAGRDPVPSGEERRCRGGRAEQLG